MKFLQIIRNSPLPPKEIEILLSFLLDKNRESLLAHPEIEISQALYKKFKKLEKKRLNGWSIAVLIGQKEFYGLNFKVDKNVLVPRPETELMIEEILKLNKNNESNLNLIDVGTGSGAIIITCAQIFKNLSPVQYKKTNFWAIDISNLALRVAKQNAKLNYQGEKIKFVHGNLLTPLNKKLKFNWLSGEKFIIAANLPYLTPQQIKFAPSIKKEPRLALVAGRDGLKYYQALFKQLKTLNSVNKLKIDILCEIDPKQTSAIKLIIKKYSPTGNIKIKKDLAGKNRLIIISLV
jgi:release factor glutamine methyltransferase